MALPERFRNRLVALHSAGETAGENTWKNSRLGDLFRVTTLGGGTYIANTFIHGDDRDLSRAPPPVQEIDGHANDGRGS